ncbi:copper resistance protein CopC [Nonomuraea sp. NPDC050022]|uniref:copper resistance CopC family protein n=1 Tax=unclassified Nonomuraea TaxID=2593643 RepID=UPI0033CE8BD2
MASLPRFVLAALCTAAFVMLGAPAALAHDGLKSSSPAKNAKVAVVKRIKLEFHTRVRFPTVVLSTADGKKAAVGKAKVSGATVTAAVSKPLAAGKYVIAWRVVSSDGHPNEGKIPFKVTGLTNAHLDRTAPLIDEMRAIAGAMKVALSSEETERLADLSRKVTR